MPLDPTCRVFSTNPVCAASNILIQIDYPKLTYDSSSIQFINLLCCFNPNNQVTDEFPVVVNSEECN